jgi:hypothetical protein
VRTSKARGSASASPGSQLTEDLRSLGEAFTARGDHVVEQTLARAKQRDVDAASRM